MRNFFIIILVFFMFLGCSTAFSAPSNTISIPNSFSPLTTIQSAQTNANNNEIQSKFNAHSHTDITQLGTIVTGTWNGTAVSTQYGGTGKDWSATAQGNVPYFNGAGTLTTLSPGSSGQFLTSGGSGANVSWTSGGSAKDSITRGFEASASVGSLNISVYAGTLFHGSTAVDVATTTVLTFATARDWSSGSVVSYAGGAGWNYIGVQQNDLDGYIKLLGSANPTASDSSGNTSGTNLYSYDGSKWWRVIGAVRMATTNRVSQTQYQHRRTILFDDGINHTGLAANVFTDLDLSTDLPKIATTVFYNIDINTGSVFNLRPNGSSAATGMQLQGAGTGYFGFPMMSTDSSQIVEYKVAAGNSTFTTMGYELDIR